MTDAPLDPNTPTPDEPRTDEGRDLLAHSVQYSPADADKLVTGAKIRAVEDAGARAAAARIAALEGALALRPSGHVGLDEIPWFIHSGISHAEGAKCVVCALLSGSTPPDETAR